MEIGIVGLPQSGKSLLFEIMTGIRSRDFHREPCVRGQAAVPDPRVEMLAEIYRREWVVRAKVPFVDAQTAGEKKWEVLRQVLMGTDCLLHVVDGFTALDVKEVASRYQELTEELILADLQVMENRLDKLDKLARFGKKTISPTYAAQKQLFITARERLEAGKTMREMDFTPEEIFSLKGFGFWTIKPELIVINVGEDNIHLAGAYEQAASRPVIGICCGIEAELKNLSSEEQKDYLSSLGYDEPAFARIIKRAFAALGQISFFTVGEDEVRAWVIPAGTKAPQAAAAIHKDFERGFIKAEVVGYEDFMACGGAMSRARAAGKVRLEGKGYIVQDGDIITFRFNV